MPDAIVTRAPTRIDFGGGWTDVPPYSDELGGFVCNVAIDRYATVTVTRSEAASEDALARSADRSLAAAALRRFEITGASVSVASDFPIGAGLGGSSAAGVAMVSALATWTGRTLSPSEIAELSRDIEIADLGIAGGRQDHYAAAYGGALGLRFSRESVQVERLSLSDTARAAIEQRCLIVYTGQSRISSETIRAVLDSYRNAQPTVLRALAQMKLCAEQMAKALAAGDIDSLGGLVAEQWTHQRSLHPAIPTPQIDEIIARARAAGAIGSKALGASGGGCVLVVAPREGVEQVRTAVAPLGELLSFSIDDSGVQRCQ